MNTLHASALCAMLGLGEPVAEPQIVAGGYLHRVWYLPTADGAFAVKQLNPAIVSRSDLYDAYRLTERIAASMVAQGIPAIAALNAERDPLLDTADGKVMVYEWIDGQILLPGPVEPALARQIGVILARIHALQLQLPMLALPEATFVEDDWDLLTFHAADRGIPWAYQVRALMPRLLEWSELAAQAVQRLDQTLVVGHCHLEQKNVIWCDAATFKIIDWEASGLINPTLELAGVALNWSGQTTGAPREETFAALLEGYVSVNGAIRDTGLDALHGLIAIKLGWLLFNMRRSLGEFTTSEEERLRGIRETSHTLSALRSLGTQAELWAGWIERWR